MLNYRTIDFAFPEKVKAQLPSHPESDVEGSCLNYAVGYHSGFTFYMIAAFEEAEHADLFADALNAKEGFAVYVPVNLLLSDD